VDRSHSSVLDSEADCGRERTDLLGVLDLLANLDPGERVARPDADADQGLKLFRKPVQMRRAARQDDLADAQRIGLLLVELERGDEFTRRSANASSSIPTSLMPASLHAST